MGAEESSQRASQRAPSPPRSQPPRQHSQPPPRFQPPPQQHSQPPSQHSPPPRSQPPPQSLEFDKPWRAMPWGKTKDLEEKLSQFKLNQPNADFVRILIVGDVGAGKSSFINSVNNAFQHRITSGAIAATASGTSFTKEYETHYIERPDGSVLPFIFSDVMGLEADIGKGARTEDIIKALQGFMKDGYNFDSASPLYEASNKDRDDPDITDQCFCLVNVVDGSKVSFLSDGVIKKLKLIREAATALKMPQFVIMTKPDEACPLFKNDLQKVYCSKKIKEKMQQCSNLIGIPMNHIFPVKNYHEEMDTDDDMDLLILKALDQIVHTANDALRKKCRQLKTQKMSE